MNPSILRADGSWADTSGVQQLPLADYLELGAAAREGLGVRLGPVDEPEALSPYLDRLPLIAVEFPSFKDGRGFSTAFLLRSRFGYRGDLRAVGDVLVDQLWFLRRVGFSSFVLRADQEPETAVALLRPFSDSYQGSVDDPRPRFRRRSPVGVST